MNISDKSEIKTHFCL